MARTEGRLPSFRAPPPLQLPSGIPCFAFYLPRPKRGPERPALHSHPGRCVPVQCSQGRVPLWPVPDHLIKDTEHLGLRDSPVVGRVLEHLPRASALSRPHGSLHATRDRV